MESSVDNMNYPKEFIDFWNQYPSKVAKLYAFKAWQKALKIGALPKDLIEGAKKYSGWLAQKTDKEWRPEPANPSSWLNQGRWEDQYPEQTEQQSYVTPQQRRIQTFKKTGFWMQDWGEKPILD